MKKLLIVLCFILPLSGCAATQVNWETVDDPSAVSASLWSDGAGEIFIELPAEAQAMYETQDQAYYAVNDGELEIVTVRFLCSDTASAARLLTGFDLRQLNTVEKSSTFGDELFATWCAQTEEGSRVYSADIVTDGQYAYCVICSFHEDAERRYDREIQDVFSGFTLRSENTV